MFCDVVIIEVPPLEKGVRGIFKSYDFLKIPLDCGGEFYATIAIGNYLGYS